jgi:hypothetical protein
MIGQRTVHPRRWAAAAGLVAVGLTASCGVRVDSTRTVGTTGGHPQHAASGQVVQASFARQAAAATTALRTGHFKITTSGTGIPSNYSVSGAYDLDNDAMEMDTSGGSGSPVPSTETLIVGGKLYLKVPPGLGAGVTKPWMSLTLGAGSGPGTSMAAGMDPQVMLKELQAITGGLTVLGHETIDGIDTTHYHGTIDPAKIMAKAGEGAGADMAGHMGTIPIDIWVDGQGRLVRQQTSVSGLEGMADSGSTPTGDMTVTVDYTDLGGPVAITAPPADQVQAFDPSQLMKSLGSGSSLPRAPAN